MKKKINIWSIVLIAIGILGLAAVERKKTVESKELEPYKEKFSQGTDVFFKELEEYLTTTKNKEMTSEMLVEYGKKQKELKANQNDMLMADLAALSAGQKQPCVLAEMKYGTGWKEKVEAHRIKEGLFEFLLISSIVSIVSGLAFGALTSIKAVASIAAEKRAKAKTQKPQSKKRSRSKKKKILKHKKVETEPVAEKPEIETKTEEDVAEEQQTSPLEVSQAENDTENDTEIDAEIDAEIETDNEQSDDAEVDQEETPKEETPKESATSQFGKYNRKGRLHEAGLTSMQFGNENGNAFAGLGAPIVQTSQMMSTAPVNKSISDLSEQVSAIRQFATQQQDRVRQLQDGYDWSIIKRVCIRIIRCIDNLNNRIKYVIDDGGDPESLEDIRDELVFALESSGVEQFLPPLESEYKGIEKYAEALHQREETDNEYLAGRIAKVTRPGYQYVVSEEEVKIVRCAQVILYSHQITNTVGA